MSSLVFFVDRSISIIRIRSVLRMRTVLCLLFVLVVFLFVCTWSSVVRKPSAKIVVPFGGILGVSVDGVTAYSNGNDSIISSESNYFHGFYSGLKWQCVEYSRRWLLSRANFTFESIDGAKDLWTQVKFIENVWTKKKRKLIHHRNGATSRPMNDSLLIYPIQKQMPFGHVAVIHQVLPAAIRIGEQNFDFFPWTQRYAREIPLKHINGRFFLEDQFEVYGWIEFGVDE